MENKPKIVCLCGSTRFYKQFQEQNYFETMAGNIVLSVGFYPHSAVEAHGKEIGITPQQKLALDELHKCKIDLAGEVLVINPGGYIGDSTKSEIEYAIAQNKPVRYLENEFQKPAIVLGSTQTDLSSTEVDKFDLSAILARLIEQQQSCSYERGWVLFRLQETIDFADLTQEQWFTIADELEFQRGWAWHQREKYSKASAKSAG